MRPKLKTQNPKPKKVSTQRHSRSVLFLVTVLLPLVLWYVWYWTMRKVVTMTFYLPYDHVASLFQWESDVFWRCFWCHATRIFLGFFFGVFFSNQPVSNDSAWGTPRCLIHSLVLGADTCRVSLRNRSRVGVQILPLSILICLTATHYRFLRRLSPFLLSILSFVFGQRQPLVIRQSGPFSLLQEIDYGRFQIWFGIRWPFAKVTRVSIGWHVSASGGTCQHWVTYKEHVTCCYGTVKKQSRVTYRLSNYRDPSNRWLARNWRSQTSHKHNLFVESQWQLWGFTHVDFRSLNEGLVTRIQGFSPDSCSPRFYCALMNGASLHFSQETNARVGRFASNKR